jgi:hypothetical protein
MNRLYGEETGLRDLAQRQSSVGQRSEGATLQPSSRAGEQDDKIARVTMQF